MAEYIEREAFLEAMKKTNRDFAVKFDIEGFPAADVGPVVRCKDCAYSYEDIGGRVCSHGVCVDCAVAEDFFCAEGERRDGDGNG